MKSKHVVVAFLVMGVSGCASSESGTCQGASCREAGAGGGGDDLAVPDDLAVTPPDSSTPPDLIPPKMFGDSCTDRSQCASGICVFSGLGGVCSALCPAIGCPQGYGCYSVLGGGVDPGATVDICVPENNLLCTPCSKASECGSPLGKDFCLPYPTGTFCGRDCSAISCPPTYSCQALPMGDGGTVKQCVPNNNACDCSPASVGRQIACNINTPTGTKCTGMQTCNGAQGWSTCGPKSTTDLPDDNFVDDNCDGIDGNASDAVFVDVLSGNDNFPGTMQKPVLSIPKGIALAQANNKHQILVSKGTYSPLTLVSGAQIYGGYDAANNWQRSSNNVATIAGGNPAVDGANIGGDTRLDHFTITGASATGGSGQSAYGARVVGSTGPVIFHACTITAGDATDGVSGFDGFTGANGGKGGTGANACENCSSPSTGGGRGFSACNAGGMGGGGTGGTGNSNGGETGFGVAPGGGGGSGCGCDKSATLCATTCSCSSTRCQPGTGGTGSFGGNGSNGGPAMMLGGVNGNVYVPSDGYDGIAGGDGSGGGGGGGGAGSNGPCFCNEYTGGGGGGGGGAGCAGGIGTHGSGGGGSFAVFVIGSTVKVESCGLTSGKGGRGGSGGAGGLGGAAGGGGNGSGGFNDGEPGAPGGPGGAGGAAGSASGGAGGPSFGIYAKSATVTNSGNSYGGGTAGAGGSGGSNLVLGKASDGPSPNSNIIHQE